MTVVSDNAESLYLKAQEELINVRLINSHQFSISVDETTTDDDLQKLYDCFGISSSSLKTSSIPESLLRKNAYLTHPVFNRFHSETEMMRYLKRLENKDIALNHSMIALGSCTMKLNAAIEMMPVSLPGFSKLHPYAPEDQTLGYQRLFLDLERALIEATGYDAISLQPNSGSQGEYTGLLAIRSYHLAKGDNNRNVCLIPSSAHGTNPASAIMAGMNVVIVKCDKHGNVDVEDLADKIDQHQENLAAIMVTYPSTHGVFESKIETICQMIHDAGGMVYLDGANMNAMVGVTQAGKFGADVSHINLHKTFAIPHGGGGPGMGPIGVKAHLKDFLPGNPLEVNSNAVSAAKYGSASILPISWSYIKLLGSSGMAKATEVAILSANYIAKSLESFFSYSLSIKRRVCRS